MRKTLRIRLFLKTERLVINNKYEKMRCLQEDFSKKSSKESFKKPSA